MDLGAYGQIEDLKHVLIENEIYIPRLRGLRAMKNENKIELTPERIENIVSDEFYDMCRRRMYKYPKTLIELSRKTDRLLDKYAKKKLVHDDAGDIFFTGIYIPDFTKIHGKNKKKLKLAIKNAIKKHKANYDVFNKYVGRDDVLYIHARIGGDNWSYYEGEEIAKKPWFLEKVDDPFDDTYCDIYVKVKPVLSLNKIVKLQEEAEAMCLDDVLIFNS